MSSTPKKRSHIENPVSCIDNKRVKFLDSSETQEYNRALISQLQRELDLLKSKGTENDLDTEKAYQRMANTLTSRRLHVRNNSYTQVCPFFHCSLKKSKKCVFF